jgi:hypothetical protein
VRCGKGRERTHLHFRSQVFDGGGVGRVFMVGGVADCVVAFHAGGIGGGVRGKKILGLVRSFAYPWPSSRLALRRQLSTGHNLRMERS